MALSWSSHGQLTEYFLLLLVAWTPDPTSAQLIEGVQGRYF